MKEKWSYEEIENLIDKYLLDAKKWLESEDIDTAYRFLTTAIKLREIK